MIRLETFSTSECHYINAYSGCVRVGKLGIEKKGNNKVNINYVVTNINYTSKGIATMMLNKAIEMFKGYEISLLVKPMPRTGENIKYRTTKGLVEFYKKFGFVRTDDPCLTTMILKN
jgi:GNAT superfamily N-acetyltransferase